MAAASGAAPVISDAVAASNLSEQTEETEALRSIYPELALHPKTNRYQLNIVLSASNDSKSAAAAAAAAGSVRVLFEFWYSKAYPSHVAPDFFFESKQLTKRGLLHLREHLLTLWTNANGSGGGSVIVYVWIQWLVDDSLTFLISKDSAAAPVFESAPANSNAATAATAAAVAVTVSSAPNSTAAALPPTAAAPVAAPSAIDVSDCPTIYHSAEPVRDRKSTFIAHFARVTSEHQLRQVMHVLYQDRKVATATHNISAYRIAGGTAHRDDDGESGAGDKLLALLTRLQLDNIVVICTRWYGGIHLGNDRFRIITSTVKTLLDAHGLTGGSTSAAAPSKSKK